MSGTASWALLLGGVGLICLLALLGRLWSIGGRGEAPLGPLHPPRPDESAPTLVPAQFRVLINAEARQWKGDAWRDLLVRLDGLAAEFDVGEPATAPPRKYSAEWLDDRIRQIEAHAGTRAPGQRASTPQR